MKIAIFGTSADPPHRGHQQLLQQLENMRRFDHIYVWAVNNEQKTHTLALERRIHLTALMVSQLAPTTVMRQDLSHKHTINSILQLKVESPDAEITLVIGEDQYHNFHSWTGHPEIMQTISNLIVFNRGGLGETIPLPPKVEFIDFHCDISSTKIRDAMNMLKEYLPYGPEYLFQLPKN